MGTFLRFCQGGQTSALNLDPLATDIDRIGVKKKTRCIQHTCIERLPMIIEIQ